MQQFPQNNNPIELRKQAVRKYTQQGVMLTVGGVVGGLALWALFGHASWLIIGLVIAVAGGGVNYQRVTKILNHRDPQ